MLKRSRGGGVQWERGAAPAGWKMLRAGLWLLLMDGTDWRISLRRVKGQRWPSRDRVSLFTGGRSSNSSKKTCNLSDWMECLLNPSGLFYTSIQGICNVTERILCRSHSERTVFLLPVESGSCSSMLPIGVRDDIRCASPSRGIAAPRLNSLKASQE